MRKALAFLLLFLTTSFPAAAQDEPTLNSPFDFAISRSFLEQLWAQKTFLPTFEIKMLHRSDIKSLADDCEVHLAGEFTNVQFGIPPSVIVEPPNVCKFIPSATQPTTQSTKAAWRNLLDQRVIGRTCKTTGFPRIFTEHAQGREVGTSNPNHVFEIHPATAISCGGSEPLELAKFLRAFPGLRHIKPESADDCIARTRLWVRHHGANGEDQYEFFEKRSPRCGNFAIVEAGGVPQEWIRQTNGGHTAIARVSADGGQRRTLKLYTIQGTEADAWLERLRNGVVQPTDSRLVHGGSDVRLFRHRAGAGARREVHHAERLGGDKISAALIVFGPTDVVPWVEQ